MRRMNNYLIFGSMLPRNSKTRWRTKAYAYGSALSFDKNKNKKKKNASSACVWAYVCAMDVLTTTMLMLGLT